MKTYIEISKMLSGLQWNIQKLSQALNESEFNVKYALQNREETDTRQKISEVTGISYPELFGEEQ